jgi:hypothetical protein
MSRHCSRTGGFARVCVPELASDPFSRTLQMSRNMLGTASEGSA